MAHFYGSIQGCRGAASRLGGAGSGLRTYAASWSGAVSVRLCVVDGVDIAIVSLTKHNGAGIEKEIYRGPVSGAKKKGK